MDDHVAKAFDLAQDAAKQVLTISAGVIVVTITFFADFGKHAPFPAKVIMALAWALYLLSMLTGISFLYTLAGNLQGDPSPSIYAENARLLSISQLGSFLLAVLLTVLAGALTWL